MARVRKPASGSTGMSPELKTIILIAGIAVVVGIWMFLSQKDETKDGKGDTVAATSADDKPSGAAGDTGGKPDAPKAGSAAAPYPLEVPAHGPADAPAVLVKYTDFQ